MASVSYVEMLIARFCGI